MASLADLLLAAQGQPPAPQGRGLDVLAPLLAPYTGRGSDPLASLLAGRSRPAMPAPAMPGGSTPATDYSSGDALAPGSPLLVTRRGVTLQQGALDSLLRAARMYDQMRGARELGLFGAQASYRTPAQQAALYASKPDLAAPPGQSYHQQGLAIDVPAQLQTDAFARLLRRLGWNQFSPQGEPWHWSYGVTG